VSDILVLYYFIKIISFRHTTRETPFSTLSHNRDSMLDSTLSPLGPATAAVASKQLGDLCWVQSYGSSVVDYS